MKTVMPLPERGKISKLMTAIVGRNVRLDSARPPDRKDRATKIYGVYRDPNTHILGVCVVDLTLAAHLGAAMLILPLCSVEDAIRSGKLTDGMIDAANEILNVCSRIFNDNAHLVFQQLCLRPDQLPADAAAVVTAPEQRLDMQCSVEHYGNGRFTVLLGYEAFANLEAAVSA